MKKLYFLFCLLLTACATEQPVQVHLQERQDSALHAVQSKRLKVLMHELNDLMFERMLNEVQIDRQRKYRAEEIVRVADELIKTVRFIPNALPDLALAEKEKIEFLRLSEKLKQQIKLLKYDAELNHVDVLSERTNQIIETCNACHQVFRAK